MLVVMQFISVLKNSWFIGIAGGIISGLIVYFITAYFLERKKRMDHKKDIMAANRAVFEIVRPYIANSGLPDNTTLDAIMNSIARKYEIERYEMSSIATIYEDLIVEFMSNLYIPDDIKNKNINILLKNVQDLKHNVYENVEESNTHTVSKKPLKGGFSKESAVLGTTISMISFCIGFIGNVTLGSGFSIIVCGISLIVAIVAISFATIQLIKVKRANSFERRLSHRLYSKDFTRMVNHGTPISDSFGKEFQFVDFFEGGEV